MNILIVEDERRVADFIVRGLKAEGHSVRHAEDGESALDALEEGVFDVVILDLMLPGISGSEVCSRMRARGNRTPILMLSALDKVAERIAGLRLGADDYLVKPFDFDELIARLEALNRRGGTGEAEPDGGVLSHLGLIYDPRSLELQVDGTSVPLSATERDLAVLLLSNVGRALSRERILNTVWGTQADPLTNVVDVYIGRLRRKFAAYGSRIVTLRGAGYRLD